jgi:hypothetical protein
MLRRCRRSLTTLARPNPDAMNRLEQDAALAFARPNPNAPVVLVDLVKYSPASRATAASLFDALGERLRDTFGARRLLNLEPFASGDGGGGGSATTSKSVLLGDTDRHAFDRVVFTEYPTAVHAVSALNDPVNQLMRGQSTDLSPIGSLVIRGTPASLLKGLAPHRHEGVWDGGGDGGSGSQPCPVDTAPAPGLGHPSSCPFRDDKTAHHAAWDALHEEPCGPNGGLDNSSLDNGGRLDNPNGGRFVAMNLLRIPDQAAYDAYASHFAELPLKYGFEVLASISTDVDPAASVLLGSNASGEEGEEGGQGGGGYSALIAVGFPSSRVFASCWADEAIVRAFPLRAPMWANGFEHVWLRTNEKAGTWDTVHTEK